MTRCARSMLWLGLAATIAGCGGGSESRQVAQMPDDDAGSEVDASVLPSPISDRPPCALSADCPAGQHCDLGECIQECNANVSCAAGKSCSSRARCLDPDEGDIDPIPASKAKGTLAVTPAVLNLTRANNGKTINLDVTTTATDEVRYRVEVNAPYLSVAQTRGSFTKETTIPVKVDTSNVGLQDIAGNVTIYSTLGTAMARLPLHLGLTGRYHGALRYNGGAVALGDTRFELEMIEDNGAVRVRVVPERSMLFPKGATDDGIANGFGSISGDGAVDLTIDHLLDATAGGASNHFGRPVGRRIVMHLNAPATGTFDGTFNESIYGLFEGPVRTKGAAHLEFVPDASEPNFQIQSLVMPTISASSELFPVSFSANFPASSTDCQSIPASVSAVLSDGYGTLRDSLGNTTIKYSEISDDCQAILGLKTNPSRPNSCGWVATEACLMRNSAAGNNYAGVGPAQGALVQAIIAPAALVAQQELVAALKDSVISPTGSFAAELKHYDTALSALAPIARWLMQPGMLEFFRNIPAAQAEVSPEAFIGRLASQTSGAYSELEPYPLARGLARLVQLLIDVNAERQRVASITTSTDIEGRINEAQYRSTITYLEAVALLGVLEGWAVSPPTASASMAGLLTKLDHSFTDMTQDAGDNLGAPKRHVPFVYRVEDSASDPTNFEQMLTVASKVVAQVQPLETTFKSELQQVDQAQYANQAQMQSTKTTLDGQIQELCGAGSILDSRSGAVDWSTCGKASGTLYELALEIQNAQMAAEATAQRAQGQKDKIDVDVHLVAQKKKLRDDELTFISDGNEQIYANTVTINALSAVQSMMQMASGSSLLNAGAPAAMAVADYALGLQKAGLQNDNLALQQAQDLTIRQTDADIEYAEGMANIQREQIDLCELVIEARQSIIGILEAQVRQANALSRAQQLYVSRTQANQLTSSDPSMDPSYRLVRNSSALQYLAAREAAQRQLFLAGRALEYEMGHDLPTLAMAVQSARNSTALGSLQTCLDTIFADFIQRYSSPQPYSTTVSVRKLFGISGPRTDEVTGRTLSEGEQFRAYVLKNQSLDPDGSLRVQFSTNLMRDNGLWSAGTCIDKITELQAQLVGDFLGDNEAEVDIALSGTSVLRSCDTKELRDWTLDANSAAVIQAGVNSFGDVTSTSLFGQSVARSTWTLTIPGRQLAPANADVDVSHLDDIVLKIKHKAVPLQSSGGASLDDSCLADIVRDGA